MPSSVFEWQVVSTGNRGPGPRSRHGLVYDPGTRATILFGGIIWQGDGEMCDDTWELRGENWYTIESSPRPAARHRGAMVFDRNRGCTVLFGGQSPSLRFLADTWTYERGQWRRRNRWSWSGPSPRCGHAMAFDESTEETILFGGISPNDRPLGDTWIWNGERWRQIHGPGPWPRRYAAFTYDPAHEGCILNGGAVDDRGAETFGDTWLFREGKWSRLRAEFNVDPRDDHGLAYHRDAKCLVLLPGISAPPEMLIGNKSGWFDAQVDEDLPSLQCSPLTWNEQLGGLMMHGGECGHGGYQYDTTWVLRLRSES